MKFLTVSFSSNKQKGVTLAEVKEIYARCISGSRSDVDGSKLQSKCAFLETLLEQVTNFCHKGQPQQDSSVTWAYFRWQRWTEYRLVQLLAMHNYLYRYVLCDSCFRKVKDAYGLSSKVIAVNSVENQVRYIV